MWKKLLASAGTAMVLIVLPASPLKDSGSFRYTLNKPRD